jgi:hypothetical protein
MRTIADSAGVVWTVFEVKKPGGGEQWSYLPEQFGKGWLCFESTISKRRLTPVPARWSECSDRELEGLLKKAQPVSRATSARVEEETRAE